MPVVAVVVVAIPALAALAVVERVGLRAALPERRIRVVVVAARLTQAQSRARVLLGW
jgi:hypothetical protein